MLESECFWTLPNGDEWAWQAKFFSQMRAAQWQQLDESVQQALAKHPQMVRYCVCLPIDLPIPGSLTRGRIDGSSLHVTYGTNT